MTTMTTMSRMEAIRAIRAKLIELTDDEHSMCQVASEKGIYCRGFRQLTDDQLKERYAWLLRRHPDLSRQELEDLANRWQLARQIVDRVPISCDVQTIEQDTCAGWDRFDDAEIVGFYRELLGADVVISG